MSFIDFGILDIIDIVLVAILLYQLYQLVKGTVAINILIGVTAIYLLWKIVEALKMELLSEILGQFIGVGVIALIIVFQQELRRFLLMIGTTSFSSRRNIMRQIANFNRETEDHTVDVDAIVEASKDMAAEKTGALMVITRNSELNQVSDSGDRIEAGLSKRLLESIFAKNSPLHDGAVIIRDDKIIAARAVLPTTERNDVPAHFGMRHRAALGVSEQSDALVVIVSEETGKISYAVGGDLRVNLEPMELQKQLEKDLR
ncbi:TIGR00159 family protein [Cryomorphaceae bacterium]|nr:TIGR00159 family protein [Cryomorphaceae bacterium]